MVQISMATILAKNNNDGYKALMTDTQQQQRELNGAYNQLQHDKKRQQHQQEQQHLQQLHLQPFDFANLRRLQLKYKNGQSYGSGGQQEQLQQQRQQQQYRQQISHYSENNKGERGDQDNEDGNSSNNNDYSSYYRYSLGNDDVNDSNSQNNKNFDNNSNNNKANSNGNPNRDVVDDNDYEQHQDARNSFRLQSSDSNEPYSSRSGNNRKNNNNDGDENSNIAGSSSSSKSNNQQNVPISFGEMEFYDDLESNLPYGIQNVKRVPRRNENGGKVTTYQSLCPTKRVSIPLETAAYEYRPNHYIEVNCAHSYSPSHSMTDYNKNRICSEAGFACIQLNRTIHLIRRNKESPIDCWESEIRIVPSGCECMWPKHHFGDIITYHQEQKRQNSPPLIPTPTRLGELGHIESGDYLEIPVEMVIDATGQERTKNKIVDIYERN